MTRYAHPALTLEELGIIEQHLDNAIEAMIAMGEGDDIADGLYTAQRKIKGAIAGLTTNPTRLQTPDLDTAVRNFITNVPPIFWHSDRREDVWAAIQALEKVWVETHA